MALRLIPLRGALAATCLLPMLASGTGRTDAPPAAPTLPPAGWTEHVAISAGAGQHIHDHHPDVVLRIVTPEDGERITGAAKAGQFVRQVFGASSTTRLDPKHLRGTDVQAVPSPAMDLMPSLFNDWLQQYFTLFPGAIPQGRTLLKVEANEWALVYQKPKAGQQLYQLSHFTRLRLQQPDGSTVDAAYCNDPGREATLEQWQANDYARLRASARELAAACVQRFVSKLPQFFPQPLPTAGSGDGTARVRVFNSATERVTMLGDAYCLADGSRRFDDPRWPAESNANALDSEAGNLSLGIAETETLRSLKSPKYREYAVQAGQPLIFDADVRHRGAFCTGTLAVQIVPVTGVDYEVKMDIVGQVCRLNVHSVDAEGVRLAVPARRAPETCTRPDVDYTNLTTKTPREPLDAMGVFLFTDNALQVQPADRDSPPLQLADGPADAARLQTLLQQMVATPGTRACVIVPAQDHASPLNTLLRDYVLERGAALPGLWEAAETVNQARHAAPAAPLDLQAAVQHCQTLPRLDFRVQ
ncbi:hypothetical protein [Stenotrophomonas sp. B1-1]|uniref:hypothetical protein n=1 Tax=Stenotrophomonas sp. B1-1 TaxID=2710648 RepID=UPI0013DD5D1C|nr:hypothetical protein [Stenotrophomonas sp. B1-1]